MVGPKRLDRNGGTEMEGPKLGTEIRFRGPNWGPKLDRIVWTLKFVKFYSLFVPCRFGLNFGPHVFAPTIRSMHVALNSVPLISVPSFWSHHLGIVGARSWYGWGGHNWTAGRRAALLGSGGHRWEGGGQTSAIQHMNQQHKRARHIQTKEGRIRISPKP